MSRPEKSFHSPALTLAAVILAVVGLASAAFGILELVATRADRAMLGSGVGILMLAYAVFLLAIARGVWRGRRWSRAPAIATQLIQLPIAWSFHGGPTIWFSYLLGALSLTVVTCLLLPSSTKIFLGGQGAEPDPDRT